MNSPAEFFLYKTGDTWHAKAIRTPCSGHRQKAGVLRHFTTTKKAEAVQMFNRWRAFFSDGAGFSNTQKNGN